MLPPMNADFMSVYEFFTQKGWSVKKNTNNEIIFIQSSDYRLVFDEFKLSVDDNKVTVLISLANSPVAYKTRFDDYFTASNYAIDRLDDFINSYKLNG